MSRRWPRLGFRREVLLLLPVAMLLLVLLSTFTLFSYRSGVNMLVEEHRAAAAELARRAAAATGQDRRTIDGRRVIAIAADGRPLGINPLEAGESAMAPLEGRPVNGPLGVGPNEQLPHRVAGYAPYPAGSEAAYARVDLPAAALARQLATLRVLTWVILPLNVLLTMLVALYLRHLLQPYDALLAQARRVGDAGGEEDEISFLVRTFERAVVSLERPGQGGGEDEIAALQRALAPSLGCGLLLLDRHGEVLALNQVGGELLGVGEVVEPTPARDLLAACPPVLERLTAAVETGSGVSREEVEVEVAESERTLGLTVHALRRDDGSARGYMALFVDLTESRRRADEDNLAASLTQLGELTAGLAHELRNSLATLRGYLTLIERRPDKERAADYLDEMRRESDHLERVLTDFLSFARPESTQIEPVDLTEVARRAAADPSLDGKPVVVEAPDAPSLVRGDPLLLERAIRNLIHNAARAEGEERRDQPLTVRVTAGDEAVELCVDDRGHGVPPEVRERLFQPFVTGRADGVGLGLSLAHRIVTLHRGRLRLDDRPGGGTRAVIAFPPDTFVT